MKSRELDTVCARVLGWDVEPWTSSVVKGMEVGTPYYRLIDPRGNAQQVGGSIIAYTPEACAWASVPHFGSDYTAATVLIQHMLKQGWEFRLFSFNGGELWEASFVNDRVVSGTGGTDAEAVRAAFLAANRSDET